MECSVALDDQPFNVRGRESAGKSEAGEMEIGFDIDRETAARHFCPRCLSVVKEVNDRRTELKSELEASTDRAGVVSQRFVLSGAEPTRSPVGPVRTITAFLRVGVPLERRSVNTRASGLAVRLSAFQGCPRLLEPDEAISPAALSFTIVEPIDPAEKCRR